MRALRPERQGLEPGRALRRPSRARDVLSQVHNCPAGRLIAFDKVAGKTIEPHAPLAIGLIEDPMEGCSGPIWLRGGVALISADGRQYEVRNNMTASKNKPFCDGSHASIGFRATQNA